MSCKYQFARSFSLSVQNNTVVGIIAFVLPIGPLFLTYDSSNQGMYVSTGVGGQGNIKVSIINTATNAHVGDSFFPAGVDSRTMELAYNRNNNRIYVTAFDTSSIFMLNPDTNKFEGNPISVGLEPIGIIHNPSNNYMYVTNYGSDTVSVIDATTNSVVATLPTGDYPSGMAYNPNNRHIYVANTASNTVSIIHQ